MIAVISVTHNVGGRGRHPHYNAALTIIKAGRRVFSVRRHRYLSATQAEMWAARLSNRLTRAYASAAYARTRKHGG